MKRILVLNGSPVSNGNTNFLVEAFVKGAKEGGNVVNVCNLNEMNIGHCLGCFGGDWAQEHPCVIQDDMDIIYKHYAISDIIVFASPLYFWGFTGIMKTAMDRMFAAMEGVDSMGNEMWQSNENHKSAMLLIAAAVDEPSNFKAINQYFDEYLHHLGWSDAGRLCVGNLGLHTDHIHHPEALDLAFHMGKTIK
ncbi:MAG: flavodoxin family protein [Firmicutes bacterium]|nr:flavodoxin family protein [Bacillota bacterium]